MPGAFGDVAGRGYCRPAFSFLDELDAVACARRKRTPSVGRSHVDQLLQVLDAIGVYNQQVLILAATRPFRPHYAEFAKQDKRYDEVALYLRSPEVRRWKR